MDESPDSEMLEGFANESLQELQSVEQDLLSLEATGGADVEIVNRIFRAVHSIKGVGSFMNLENLVTVSHRAETLLDDIRAGRRSATSDITDAILGAVDALSAMLESEDAGATYECNPILQKLDHALGGAEDGAEEQSSSPAAANENQALFDEFINESRKCLGDIEQDLLELETAGNSDNELVNRIFRAVHSIKGAAQVIALENLVALSHQGEMILESVRSGELEVTSQVTDAILSVVDAIAEMVQADDLGESFDTTEVAAKIEDAMSGESSRPDSEIPESDLELLRSIKGMIQPLYRIVVDLQHLHGVIDVKEGIVEGLSSFGKIRHSIPPVEEIDSTLEGECTLYYETVLKPKLLCSHLSIDESLVELVDLGASPKKEKSKSNEAKASKKPASKKTAKKATDSKPNEKSASQVKAAKSASPSGKKEDAGKSEGTAGKSAKSKQDNAPAQPSPTSAATNAAPPAKKANASSRSTAEQTMRVPARILHELLEWTGNMVMARNQLLNEYDFRDSNAFRTLSQAITGVHETVIETRMQTTGSLFERYRRVVRDLSRQLKKEVAFHIEGGDLELDRTILDSFSDPLTHLVRNCIDHALETPEERLEAGKNRQGNVYLRSYVQSGEIILAVEDDGRGISSDYVCSKAVSKGLLTEDEASDLSEDEKLMLIFKPGFSTKEQATDVSGRGVGMDVVKNNIESVGGTIDLKTTVGKGSTFAARLPLAKALVSSSLTTALIVEVAEERFAIPETAISEIIQFDDRTQDNIQMVDRQQVYQHRDKLVALIDLRTPLGIDPHTEGQNTGKHRGEVGFASAKSKRACLVIIQFRDQLFGTVVDQVVGMHEIIVRSNPKLIQDCRVYSGHTVLGDGQIALILDINGIVNEMGLKLLSPATEKSESKSPVAKLTEPAAVQKMLIFNNSDSEYFAIPIELVAFIERIQKDALRTVGEKEFCQLKAETLSIIRLEEFLPVTPLNRERDDMCLIRPAAVEHPIGVITGTDTSVVDVAETFETRLDDASGIVGTFYHNDNLVSLLDLFCILEKHAPEKIVSTSDETRNARILVVEDSLFFRKLISQYMQRDEWEIEIVNDGQEAYDRLMNEPNRFDLVVSDINMPRMDGFELVQRIREDKRFEKLPMVALTTMSDEHFQQKGLACGFDRYVIKIDKREVRSTVAECLKIRRGGNA